METCSENGGKRGKMRIGMEPGEDPITSWEEGEDEADESRIESRIGGPDENEY